MTLHPQYITDTAGKKMVILPAKEFEAILEELEDIEDVKLYDAAKKNDTGERIPAKEVFKLIEAKRQKKSKITYF